MKKRKIRTWVKVVLIILVVIAIYQLFTLDISVSTVAGDYNCKGGIIKVCTGSKEVATYLGV